MDAQEKQVAGEAETKQLLPDGTEYVYQPTCYCPLCVEERKEANE